MNTPTHLGHSPIVVVNNYDIVDEKALGSPTDAKALSIGLAQYNRADISAKIFRHTGDMWSRQSEEMPLHRVLDLTSLMIDAMLICQDKGDSPQVTVINNVDLEILKKHFKDNSNTLESRLRQIRDSIDKLGI